MVCPFGRAAASLLAPVLLPQARCAVNGSPARLQSRAQSLSLVSRGQPSDITPRLLAQSPRPSIHLDSISPFATPIIHPSRQHFFTPPRRRRHAACFSLPLHRRSLHAAKLPPESGVFCLCFLLDSRFGCSEWPRYFVPANHALASGSPIPLKIPS